MTSLKNQTKSRPIVEAARQGPGRPSKIGPDSVPQIKSVALRLFAKSGYVNTSLEEIAKVVGITKGGVYYYFRSKEKLLLDILDDIQARSIDETSRVMAASGASALHRLRIFTNTQARWASRNPEDLAILMLTSIETANENSSIGERVRAIYTKMKDLLTSTIDEAKAGGEIDRDLSTSGLVLSLIAVHDGNMLLWYRSGFDPETGHMLASAFSQILVEKFSVPVRNTRRSHA